MSKEKQAGILAAASAFLVVLLSAAVAPMNGEDFGLTRRFTTETLFDRLSFAFSRSGAQIENWNARLGEQFAIFSLSLPNWFMIIIAIISLFALTKIIAKIAGVKCDNEFVFLTTFSIIICLLPSFELITWKTILAGYTVPLIITLYVSSVFLTKETMITVSTSKPKLLFSVSLAFLAGISFENVPVAIAVFMLLSLTFNKMLKSSLTLVPVACLIGWALLMSAPSTANRVALYKKMYGFKGFSVDYFINRILDVLLNFYNTTIWLFIISALSLLALIAYKKITKEIVFLIISALMVVGSMVVSPYTEPRSFALAWCVMIAVVTRAIFNFCSITTKASVTFGVIGLATSLTLFSITLNFNNLMTVRDSYILSNLGTTSCKEGLHLSTPNSISDYRFINNRDIWYFNNIAQISKYYDCNLKK